MKKLILIATLLALLAVPRIAIAEVKPMPNLTGAYKDMIMERYIQNGSLRTELLVAYRLGQLNPAQYTVALSTAWKQWFLDVDVKEYIKLADDHGINKVNITLQDIADTRAQYKIDLGIE